VKVKEKAFTLAALLVLLAFLTLQAPLIAQELTVNVDKRFYVLGETVTVSGSCPQGSTVIVKVSDPKGSVVFVDQLWEGYGVTGTSYRTSFKLPSSLPYPEGSPVWTSYGLYRVEARSDARIAYATFTLRQTPVQPSTIAGNVTDCKGKPLEGVKVSVKETGLSTATNSSGIFKLTVEPGTYTLTFTKENYYAEELNVTAAEGETAYVSVTLTGVIYVEGTVVNEKNAPLQGVRVSALKDGEVINEAYTDADGYFKLKVRPGDITFVFEKEDYLPERISMALKEDPPVTLNVKMTSVEERLRELEHRVAELEARSLNATLSLEQAEKELKELKRDLSTLEENLKGGMEVSEALRNELKELNKKLSSLEQALTVLRQERAGMEQSVQQSLQRVYTYFYASIALGIVAVIIAVAAIAFKR